MELIKYFFNELKRDHAIAWFSQHGFCIHTYRYVAGGTLIYCIKYWK